MHACLHHPIETLQQDGRGRWDFPWKMMAGAALGFALLLPLAVQAKTFHCGAGDVQCLIVAIDEANANGQKKNTIRLEAGTYTLTAVDNDTDGSNGLPVLTSTLTITGAGATATSIARGAGAPAFRLLQVATTGVLTLDGLTLHGGAFPPAPPGVISIGGGILNSGTLTLTESTITANGARFSFSNGGGIFNSGTLTLIKSIITANGAGQAGGIFNTGILTVTKSSITDNIGDGAGGIANSGGTVTITHSTIAHHFGNHESGGLSNIAGTVFITTTTFADNLADGGSAINNRGTLTITESSFTDNIAYFSGTGTISNAGILEVTNTTFARNLVVGFREDAGAGIANFGTLILTNSTLADNRVEGTFALGSALASVSGATTILQNTLFARNVGSVKRGPDCFGVVTSLGNNLIDDPTGCTITLQPSDLTGDPGLDAFADNSTPGNGHFPLLPTSQAIDAGNDAGCPKRDQLGRRRVNISGVGTSICDIGAIEFRSHRGSTAEASQ